jgi:hypothetical protein
LLISLLSCFISLLLPLLLILQHLFLLTSVSLSASCDLFLLLLSQSIVIHIDIMY